MSEQPPPEGRIATLLAAVRGLTLSNVLVIALLAAIAIPVYIVYRALDDEKLLDRFMSTYEEISSQQAGCVVRHVQARGGPDQWGISAGFAFQGADRWFVNVVLDHAPSSDEVVSYCESLKLISDTMLARGSASEVLGGPVQGAETDGGQRHRIVPRSAEEEEAQ